MYQRPRPALPPPPPPPLQAIADAVKLEQTVAKVAPQVAAGLGAVGIGSGTVATALPAIAAVAIPLATVGVMAYALFGGASPQEQLWEAQQIAMYSFHREDVALTSPYDGDVHHFGNYTGPDPIDMTEREPGVRRGR